MANLNVTEEYSSEMEALNTNTPAHADRFNERYNQLLNNDEYLRNNRNGAHVFETTDDMYAWLSDPENKGKARAGDDLLIVDTGVPDWWVAAVLEEPDEDGRYYRIAEVETQDVDDHAAVFVSADTADPDEWTDVPLLASGEKHKSIFNKISTMFKNARFLYKMLGTTDISAIGDGTVTGAVSALNTDIGSWEYQQLNPTFAGDAGVTGSGGAYRLINKQLKIQLVVFNSIFDKSTNFVSNVSYHIDIILNEIVYTGAKMYPGIISLNFTQDANGDVSIDNIFNVSIYKSSLNALVIESLMRTRSSDRSPHGSINGNILLPYEE